MAASSDGTASVLKALCDRKYDVIAMTNASGAIQERIAYTPYDVATQRLHAEWIPTCVAMDLKR